MQAPFDDELLKNERVLWLTVVEQAMRDTMESKPSVRRKACEWLLYDDDFAVICGLAGIDSSYLRRRISHLTQSGISCRPQGASVASPPN
jgi:hypothetical protein